MLAVSQPGFDKVAYQRSYMTQVRAERRAAGLCTHCPPTDLKPARPGRATCAGCVARSSATYHQNRTRRQAAGLCFRCAKSPPLPSAVTGLCDFCFCRRLSQSHFNGLRGQAIKDCATALLDLFRAQGGQCAYTGRLLTLGVDAEVDHIHPLSKGGSTHISNLQWVCGVVNQMKYDLLESEFLAICQSVAANSGRLTSSKKGITS